MLSELQHASPVHLAKQLEQQSLSVPTKQGPFASVPSVDLDKLFILPIH